MPQAVVVEPETLNPAYWRRHAASEPEASERCVETLAALCVDVVVEVGPDSEFGATVRTAWPEAARNIAAPVVLSNLGRSPTAAHQPCWRNRHLQICRTRIMASVKQRFKLSERTGKSLEGGDHRMR